MSRTENSAIVKGGKAQDNKEESVVKQYTVGTSALCSKFPRVHDLLTALFYYGANGRASETCASHTIYKEYILLDPCPRNTKEMSESS